MFRRRGWDRRSPIFLQFLDCAWQLWRQFPRSFEFSESLLSFLARASYTCRFGTFCYNSQRERIVSNVVERTSSVWEHVFSSNR